MSFEDYDPPSSLVVEGKEIKKAKYPFVDVHSHQWRMPTMDLNELVSEMDEINMEIYYKFKWVWFRATSS